MRSGAAAYLGLSMLDGLDAMNLLAELIDGDITPKVFINLLQEHQVYPYVCSEKLCWSLQKYRHEQKMLQAQLASIFRAEDHLSPKENRDEDMMVLTQHDVEVEFSKGTYQKILECFLEYESGRFYFSRSLPNEFEGVSTTGELVRWCPEVSVSDALRPVFQSEDIKALAEQVKKGCTVNEAPSVFKYKEGGKLILDSIKEHGYDPKALPDSSDGLSGVKALVRAKLNGKPPFKRKTAFKGQWQRLRDEGQIKEVNKLPPMNNSESN